MKPRPLRIVSRVSANKVERSGRGKVSCFQEETIYKRIKTLVIFFLKNKKKKKKLLLFSLPERNLMGRGGFFGGFFLVLRGWGWGKERGERPARTPLLIVRWFSGIQKMLIRGGWG